MRSFAPLQKNLINFLTNLSLPKSTKHEKSKMACPASLIILLFVAGSGAQAQNIPKNGVLHTPDLVIDPAGELKIKASASSSPHDFDFLVGNSSGSS